MLPGFLLSLREGIEAALIIGILLSVINKIDARHLKKHVWGGTAAGIILSLLAAVVLMVSGAAFEGEAEEIFEGLTMLVAAGVITWMILWMNHHASRLSSSVRDRIEGSSSNQAGRALFILAVTAILREGIELSLFLTSASFTAGRTPVLIGGLLGILTAVLLAWLLNRGLLKFSLRVLFNVSSIFLVIFAAGLVAHGVHELNEVGWIPVIIEHVWDINPILDENSTLGAFMVSLVGYNGNPSLTEVLAYLLYSFGIAAYLIFARKDSTVIRPDKPHPTH